MRTISTNLKNHIASETTTIATCLKMVRKDGKEFYLTDHDVNLTIGLETYIASSSYNRTAIETNNRFSIDNIDLSGFFASGFLEEAEFRAGLFDYSEIELFIVNYANTSHGKMILKKGFLGQLEIEDDGIYTLEVRGLKQSLAQNFGAKYQAECRAALGDSKCTMPIKPDYIARDTDYSVGDFVVVQLNNLAATDYAIPATNADFESGTTGWTTQEGSFTTSGSNPYSGTLNLRQNSTDQVNQLYQDVDLSTEPSFSTSSADNGYLALYGHFAQMSDSTSDIKAGLRFRVQALDTNKVVLKSLYKSEYSRVDPADTWELKHVPHNLLPTGTRYLRLWVEVVNHSGSSSSESLDDIDLRIIDLGGNTGMQELFGNRIYECTTAGTTASATPSYSSTIDANNTDGTAVFTTRLSYTVDAVVNTVTDRQTFTLTLTETRAVDDWFNYGAIFFEDGPNAGISMEIKDWDRTGGDEITLYLPLPYDVTTGENCSLYAGCDKKLSTCLGRFAIANSTNYPSSRGNTYNFRGEPFIPGRDFFAIGARTTTVNNSSQGKK